MDEIYTTYQEDQYDVGPNERMAQSALKHLLPGATNIMQLYVAIKTIL